MPRSSPEPLGHGLSSDVLKGSKREPLASEASRLALASVSARPLLLVVQGEERCGVLRMLVEGSRWDSRVVRLAVRAPLLFLAASAVGGAAASPATSGLLMRAAPEARAVA